MSIDDSPPQQLWAPDEQVVKGSNLQRFLDWLKANKQLAFHDYDTLWSWSVTHTNAFWSAIWEYFDVLHSGSYSHVLSDDPMPYVRWFEGTQVSYAEHIFRMADASRLAIVFINENNERRTIEWSELTDQVAGLRSTLQEMGVQKGDRVVGWLPNLPEAIIAFLAVNSLGAIWSSTSPDFGTSSVIDRFAQISPKILIAADGYQYNGKVFDKLNDLQSIQRALPSVTHTILVPFVSEQPDLAGLNQTHLWGACLKEGKECCFERVAFSDPIWVLYSSGTTGLPKAITHSNGGALLEHLKYLAFHNDVKPGERFFWFTTTGWMMWNYQMASMLCGSTVVLYEGSPSYPTIDRLWSFASENGIQHFGTSAPYVVANMKNNSQPGTKYDLSAIRSIGSTGAPLPPEGFSWIYDNLPEVWLTSISGGTDVCSAFVGGNPLWPVYSGEIQCIALGCGLEALDEKGQPLKDEVGEMVITTPMPSMPIYFWNDESYTRYKESYFEMFPGQWRHGDWIKITPRNGVVIYGRSDATLNRGGVRIGTAEIYSALDQLKEVKDAIVVCIDREDGSSVMPLFVVTEELTETLEKEIKTKIRTQCSPRHVPDLIVRIDEVPYTISGKKTEAPVKKILMGKDINHSLNQDALKNPKALDFFVNYHKKGLF